MPDLNPTAASLLGFLHQGELTGLDLVQLATTFIGDFWSRSHSQIYRELEVLERRGLVTAGPPGKRQRRPFGLTDAGRAAFTEWLRAEPGPEHHRMPFLIKVSFAAQLEPAALADQLIKERRVHEERLATYRSLEPILAAAADEFVAATLACGIFHEQAMVDWFDSLPAEWTNPAGTDVITGSTPDVPPPSGSGA